MKFSVIVFVGLTLLSCQFEGKKNPQIKSDSSMEQLRSSNETWQKIKLNISSYAYKVGKYFEFGQEAWESTVYIEKEIPLCRKFENKIYTSEKWSIKDSYKETIELGKNLNGFKPLSLDEIYLSCENLLKQEKNVELDFFDNGILKSCYLPCDGTCYQSISLKEISLNIKNPC